MDIPIKFRNRYVRKGFCYVYLYISIYSYISHVYICVCIYTQILYIYGVIIYVHINIMRHSIVPINPKPLTNMALFCRQFPFNLNSWRELADLFTGNVQQLCCKPQKTITNPDNPLQMLSCTIHVSEMYKTLWLWPTHRFTKQMASMVPKPSNTPNKMG